MKSNWKLICPIILYLYTYTYKYIHIILYLVYHIFTGLRMKCNPFRYLKCLYHSQEEMVEIGRVLRLQEFNGRSLCSVDQP